jgi:hypothetical protein
MAVRRATQRRNRSTTDRLCAKGAVDRLSGGILLYARRSRSQDGDGFTKPVDTIVGEAITTWENVRPVQPVALDIKTGEKVDFLFSYRAKSIPRQYLNRHLIPFFAAKRAFRVRMRAVTSGATGPAPPSRVSSSTPGNR